MRSDYLIESEELNDILRQDNLLIIDTRDADVYERGHIPGAVNISDIFYYLCRSDNGGYPAMVAHFEKLFAQVGLRSEDRVVVYEDAMDNGYGQSCRGWFLLTYLGHKNTRVLHGGFRAWRARNMPASVGKAERPPSSFKAHIDPSVILTTEEMLQAVYDPSQVIVDVRDYAEWIGANSSPYGYDFCPRKGRIPGALWLEWYRLMRHKQGIPWYKSTEEILGVLEQLEITADTKVSLYCFKGARTSNTMLALKSAGIKNVRNYFMSWNEWSRNLSLPVEEGYPER